MIDPEVLYLILTKVAAKEPFYTLDGKSGTLTRAQLAEVYERITGNRVGTRLNWAAPIGQLNALLSKCELPPLGDVLLGDAPSPPDLGAVHAARWPAFSALKSLYARKR